MKKWMRSVVTILFVLLAFASCGRQKVGVLFVYVGTPETYNPSWMVPFFTNLFDFFPPGFFAGGPLEGNTCYTFIHYANTAEADICGVPEGTPIDFFCNEYVDNYTYPIHSIMKHSSSGDGTYEENCFSPALFPFSVATGDQTVEPDNGTIIIGPHIDAPDGAGTGIADFLEVNGFANMEAMHRRPGMKNPHREQVLRWYYGNDAAGYNPAEPEPANIKDMLAEALPGREIVFRHAWEVEPANADIYGNPAQVEGSLESMLDELIDEEKVDRIVVFHAIPYHSNSTHFGHEWYARKGVGLSRIRGKTFKECVEDLDDAYGPENEIELEEFETSKPWGQHADHPFALVKRLVEEKKPELPVIFAEQSSNYREAAQASADLVEYAIDKYSIPETASLKVITAHHGFTSGYMNAQACDYYFTSSEKFMADTVAAIRKRLSSWQGTLDVVGRPIEFAEGTNYDRPGADKPFGEVIGVAEEVEQSINGKFVNVLGAVVDNGIGKFDYIIVNPNNVSESEDTLFAMRSEILGNNIPKESDSSAFYVRDEADADGSAFDSQDIDEDFITVKVFDGAGWPSTPGCREDPTGCNQTAPVYKGSAEKPTTLILCGSYLGNKSSAGRESLTKASVKSIAAAVRKIFVAR